MEGVRNGPAWQSLSSECVTRESLPRPPHLPMTKRHGFQLFAGFFNEPAVAIDGDSTLTEARLDRVVEALKKARAISLPKGRGAAGHGAMIAQKGEDLAVGEGVADRVLAKHAAFWTQHAGPLLQTP